MAVCLQKADEDQKHLSLTANFHLSRKIKTLQKQQNNLPA